MHRAPAAVVLLLLLAGQANAQVRPIAPLQPIGTPLDVSRPLQVPQQTTIAPYPPAGSVTPVQTLLRQAYQALASAGSSNATLASRIAYAQAMQHYREGDPGGAAAYAGWALAQLPPARPSVTIEPLASEPISRPQAPPVQATGTLIGNGASLPPSILRARDAVLDGRFADNRTRDRALAAIRNAVDAWLGGDAAGAERSAAEALSLAGKASTPPTQSR